MKIKYRIKRIIVRYKQSLRTKRQLKALKKLNSEQSITFLKVKDIAIKNRTAIKFDNESNEILIILPKMLITLIDGTVKIHNTTGFVSIDFPIEGYELLVQVVNREAHKERRKLKYEVKLRILEFINSIKH